MMSDRLGDHFVKLSTTKALNRIHKSEESEKGWRKGEFGLPTELRARVGTDHDFPRSGWSVS